MTNRKKMIVVVLVIAGVILLFENRATSFGWWR